MLHTVQDSPTRWSGSYLCVQRNNVLQLALQGVFKQMEDEGHVVASDTEADDDDICNIADAEFFGLSDDECNPNENFGHSLQVCAHNVCNDSLTPYLPHRNNIISLYLCIFVTLILTSPHPHRWETTVRTALTARSVLLPISGHGTVGWKASWSSPIKCRSTWRVRGT